MAIGQKIINKKLGEILIDAGKLSNDQLQQALKIQQETGRKIGEILVDLGFCSEEDIIVSLSTQFGYPYIDINNYELTPEILKIIPKGLAKKYQCIPLDKIGNIVSFVVADPTNLMELKKQEQYLNCKMQFFLTTPSALKEAIKKYYEKKDVSTENQLKE